MPVQKIDPLQSQYSTYAGVQFLFQKKPQNKNMTPSMKHDSQFYHRMIKTANRKGVR